MPPPPVRSMFLTGAGVVLNCARAVRYIAGLVLTALRPPGNIIVTAKFIKYHDEITVKISYYITILT